MTARRLAVVGGGVAGLAGARAALAAAAERDLDLSVVVFEADGRLGGKVLTEEVQGRPLEWGPDAFLTARPWARDLAVELGLGGDLVGTGPAAGRAYLLVGGRLRPLPEGLVMGVPSGLRALAGAVTGGILGPLGALRAALEPLVPRERDRDRPVAEVARRRLGRQAADRLVAPLVAGVYGASADEVSFEVGLRDLAGRRSLVVSAIRRDRPTGPAFLAIRGGMARLPERLAQDLAERGAEVRVGVPAREILPAREGVRVRSVGRPERFDAVLLAVPAPTAAGLLREAAPGAAMALGWIRFRPSAVVLLRYGPEALGRPLDGSGYLVAPEEGRAVAACSWLSSKWPHLAGPDGEWLRAVVTSRESLALEDEALAERVEREVSATMSAPTGAVEVRLHRWPEALPLYAPGHLRRVEAAERALPLGVAVAGASYRGVGLPDCIRSGQEAGRALVARLAR